MHPTSKKQRLKLRGRPFIADDGVSGNLCISLRPAQTAFAARFAPAR
jgi:hypothetical protein